MHVLLTVPSVSRPTWYNGTMHSIPAVNLSRLQPKWCFAIALGAFCAAVGLGLAVHSTPVTYGDAEVLTDMLEHRTHVATAFMTAITTAASPAGTLMLAAIVSGAVWLRRHSVAAASVVLGSVGAAAAVTYALKVAFARARPPLVDHLVDETDYGFPSGHVTGTTALLLGATLVATNEWSRARQAVALIAPLAVIGVVAGSRLYLGVHWFSDTAAGFAVGVGGVFLVLGLLPVHSWSRWDRRLTPA